MTRMSTVSIKKALAAVAIVFATLSAGKTQAPEPAPSKARPVLELDLRKYGYELPRFVWPSFVEFTDNDHLAWAWVTVDPSPKPPVRPKKYSPPPSHLHVLIVDVQTGQMQGQREWPTPYAPVIFSTLPSGSFLSRTGNLLRLFSPKFELIWEQDLQPYSCSTSFYSQPILLISPSRQTALLSFSCEEKHQAKLLNTERFSVVAEWLQDTPIKPIAVADHWFIGSCGQPETTCIRNIDQSWRPFHPPSLNGLMNHPIPVSAVSDSTVVFGAGKEIAAVSVDGTILFRVKLAKNESFDKPTTSSGGDRFAVMENKQRGLTSAPLDMYAFPSNDRIVVFSMVDRRPIFAVRVEGNSPWTPWNGHVNRLALSPDGNLLAVVSNGILKVYRLPGISAVQQ
jgi:hypothetical protein